MPSWARPRATRSRATWPTSRRGASPRTPRATERELLSVKGRPARARTRMPRVRSLVQLRTALAKLRGRGDSVAFVPTMGALHEGHLSLVRLARRSAERVVVSMFVNPLQFGPREDYARYPRPSARDRALLTARGADLVWEPAVADIY